MPHPREDSIIHQSALINFDSENTTIPWLSFRVEAEAEVDDERVHYERNEWKELAMTFKTDF